MKIATLFDLDGVIVDTEGQYTNFWDEQGRMYLSIKDFGKLIKGQTLGQIYERYFSEMKEIQPKITEDLNQFEANMSYDYIPGAVDFLLDLRAHKAGTALVTSSNQKKMKNVYRAHPEMHELFDEILTAECFSQSKPHPECFLIGMELLKADASNSFVFEDSFHGLQAGKASGATVVALATTNSVEAIQDKADRVWTDFVGMTYDKLLLKP